ncbi:MAG: spore maturation protein [Turicibacter sp.]|nr:spore maturation protein [Turicibacter sp.]
MGAISIYVLPIFLLLVFLTAFINKTNAFDHFVEGAKEGMQTTVGLVPNIVGMIVGIKVFLASGIVDAIAQLLNPLLTTIHIDAHVLPLMILRPLSGSAALSVTTDLISVYGPDSSVGRLASIMQGSTDTTIYIITVYFAAVGLTQMKHALKLGLTADFIGFIAAAVSVSLFF